MGKWISRNSKKLMAVLSILCMITFVVQQSATKDDNKGTTVAGRIGDENITKAELTQAIEQWKYLASRVVYAQSMPSVAPGQTPERRRIQLVRAVLGNETFAAFERQPEMYLLLLKEADQMNVRVSQDELGNLLQNNVEVYENGQFLAYSSLTNGQEIQNVRMVVHNLLMLQAAFERAASTIKVSQPLRRLQMGTSYQSMTANLVEFKAKDYEAQAPAPTTQQVEDQFKKFSIVDPAAIDIKTNPHGFSYRYPDRVKLQYIEIPRTAVALAATDARKKNDYEWKRDAYKYYSEHANQFQVSTPEPATSQPSVALTLTGQKTTTRPFTEVEADARDKVINNDADALAKTIEQRINNIIAADYMSYKSAVGSNSPTTAPSSSLNAPYNSYEYLQKLAAKIQSELGVLPKTTDLSRDFLSEKELEDVPEIGKARGAAGAFGGYVISHAATFLPPDQQDNPEVLRLYQPSPPLSDSANNTYIVRLTDAQSAHAPATPAEVTAQIQVDLKAATAYDMALADAKKVLEMAKGNQSLQTAATMKNKTVIATGKFTSGEYAQIPNYDLPPTAAAKFVTDAFAMLQFASDANPHPISIIELPRDGRVTVVQVGDVTALWPANSQALVEGRAQQELASLFRQQFLSDWFNFDNVVARIHYQDMSGKGSSNTPKKNIPPIDPIGT